MTGVTEVTIRRATVDDASNVAAVMNAVIAEQRYTLFDTPFSDEEERAFIVSLGPRSALFVAELDGRILGVQSMDLFVGFARSMGHVGTVGTWLLPDARGRGIGGRLAAASLAFAREQGYSKLVIQVLADNDRALRFYRGLGFTDIGVARQHVQLNGRLLDEIYLERML